MLVLPLPLLCLPSVTHALNLTAAPTPLHSQVWCFIAGRRLARVLPASAGSSNSTKTNSDANPMMATTATTTPMAPRSSSGVVPRQRRSTSIPAAPTSAPGILQRNASRRRTSVATSALLDWRRDGGVHGGGGGGNAAATQVLDATPVHYERYSGGSGDVEMAAEAIRRVHEQSAAATGAEGFQQAKPGAAALVSSPTV